ncbi:class II fructose-bisphosphate aldolase [Rugosimonospora africana]|uniref:Uncharacterized protein n=1 Tax=Rugosimonospora africana TaxID=556532 RepID=A0A8J3QT63_9ACTN|nr:class II fructose-bisphosphate aldolase [Rugosimonospora africana]GIH16004.1 hypothetical protein Raf01_41760 [Rugosimonospora africana]
MPGRSCRQKIHRWLYHTFLGAPGARTDPDEAAAYVEATGVDALAVAVGSSHAMTDRTAILDHQLITALHHAVSVPLVLPGSSGWHPARGASDR